MIFTVIALTKLRVLFLEREAINRRERESEIQFYNLLLLFLNGKIYHWVGQAKLNFF